MRLLAGQVGFGRLAAGYALLSDCTSTVVNELHQCLEDLRVGLGQYAVTQVEHVRTAGTRLPKHHLGLRQRWRHTRQHDRRVQDALHR